MNFFQNNVMEGINIPHQGFLFLKFKIFVKAKVLISILHHKKMFKKIFMQIHIYKPKFKIFQNDF